VFEREFRGFGMVEQWDTEAFVAFLDDSDGQSRRCQRAVSSRILTRTWFHTGAYLQTARISAHFATEYYREPGPVEGGARGNACFPILCCLARRFTAPDGTVAPWLLTADEEREACRALKAAVLQSGGLFARWNGAT